MSTETHEYVWYKEDGTFENIELSGPDPYLVVEEMDSEAFFSMEDISEVSSIPITTKRYKKWTTSWGHFCVPENWDIKVIKDTITFTNETYSEADIKDIMSMQLTNAAKADGTDLVAFNCVKVQHLTETNSSKYLASALGFKK